MTPRKPAASRAHRLQGCKSCPHASLSFLFCYSPCFFLPVTHRKYASCPLSVAETHRRSDCTPSSHRQQAGCCTPVSQRQCGLERSGSPSVVGGFLGSRTPCSASSPTLLCTRGASSWSFSPFFLPSPQKVSSRASKGSVSSWKVRQSLQDHIHSIVSGHILWFQSVSSIPRWACQLAQNTWPLQLGRSARDQKPQFHLLTVTLELARLGTSELRWWVIALLIGFWYSRFIIHCCELFILKIQRSSSQ